MHEFIITPHVGVGPIHLGATRGEVAAAMVASGFVQDAARGSLVYFCRNALQVEYGSDGAADFIGVSQSDHYRASYHGVNVFDVTAEELVALIAARDESGPHVFDCDESDEFFPVQVMTLWGADRQFDRIGGETRIVWAQVGVGSRRYAAGRRD